jgi:hypothetical protein
MKKLRRFLKNHIVPHKGNTHRPHLLRPRTIFILLAGVLLSETIFLGSLLGKNQFASFGSSFLGADVISSVLVHATNTDRAQAAQAPSLVENPDLMRAAQMKADDMAKNSYFAHTSPAGITPWHWFDEAGYNYSYAGENLAINYTDSLDVEYAWMHSPEHRANILNSHFSEIGIGIAQGTYEGKQTTFVVQLFGTPALAAEITPLAQKPKTEPLAKPTTNTNVLAAENSAPKAAPVTTLDTILSSPRRMLETIFLVLSALLLLVITLLFLYKKHPKNGWLIINGALLSLILAFFIIGNTYLVRTLGRTAATETVFSQSI